jgi:F-type H+-transporting ATPase subunit b
MAVNIDIDWTIFVQFGIVLLLMLLLKQLIFTPYLKAIDEREKKTHLTRERAHRLREQADSLLAQYEGAVARGRHEAVAIRKELRLAGVQLKDGALSVARDDAVQTLATAQRNVDEQTELAQSQLEEQAQVLSNIVVEKILGRAV